MNILEEISLRTKERIAEKKKEMSREEVLDKAERMGSDTRFPFEKALTSFSGKEIAFICEVKRASPAKGLIAESFPYLQIAKDYERAGADAISVLTEPSYFKGSDQYLQEIAKAVSLPLLRKDFIIDDYMIYEAKIWGASAVLLICSLVRDETLAAYIQTAHKLGLSALVEVHDEKEVEMALNAGARIIGVNNRNLKTFEIDFATSERLRHYIPRDKIFVSESGIQTPSHIQRLQTIGANGVLVGEALMRSGDKTTALKKLRGEPID